MTYLLPVGEFALASQDPISHRSKRSKHAVRNWISHAMDELPPQTRLAIMLRHLARFTPEPVN